MESVHCYLFSCHISTCSSITRFSHGIVFASRSNNKKRYTKKLQFPKNLTEVPPDLYPSLHPIEESTTCEGPPSDSESDSTALQFGFEENKYDDGDVVWDKDEIEAIASVFQARVPQKPDILNRERPLPVPLPHKIRRLGLPTSKKLIRTNLASSLRQPVTNQIYKNPTFLINLAKDIKSLHPEENVSTVLTRWGPFLRKGSLSMTVRELGNMGLTRRALHVFIWVQSQPHLFPDDRILASTLHILVRAHELKIPYDIDNLIIIASKSVFEAMVKGAIKGREVDYAWKLVSIATERKRKLDHGVYAKLLHLLGKYPNKVELVTPLLEHLTELDDLKLTEQDCTSIMKICIRQEKFNIVEALYDWYKKSGKAPSIVMYTTLIHSRYSENRCRYAMSIVWEMEALNCLLDLPAYRVLIKLFIALNDLPRAARYYSTLKESGFSPTYDIYKQVIRMYIVSGRLDKCKEICREAELAGFELDRETKKQLLQLEK